MKTGSINHIAITVSDLKESVGFYRGFLKHLGYSFKGEFPADSSKPDSEFGGALFGNEQVGTWINLWQKNPKSSLEHYRYNVGLNHIAFHVETREELHDLFDWVSAQDSCTILDSPSNYPDYGSGYIAFYFTELNGIKIEVVNCN